MSSKLLANFHGVEVGRRRIYYGISVGDDSAEEKVGGTVEVVEWSKKVLTL
jgi:hypothetical protein